MELFGLFGKKKKGERITQQIENAENINDLLNVALDNNLISTPKDNNHNCFDEPLDKLVDGDLPWGWVYHNREFTEKISKEHSYFLHLWVNSRNNSPREQYSALKSFVMYMENAEKLCKEKGECFEFWFNEVLTGKGYLGQRKQELLDLEKSYLESQNEWERKQKLLVNLKPQVIQQLKEHDRILQSVFWKLFDDSVRSEVSDILYDLNQSGKVEKIKSGRSYVLHYRD